MDNPHTLLNSHNRYSHNCMLPHWLHWHLCMDNSHILFNYPGYVVETAANTTSLTQSQWSVSREIVRIRRTFHIISGRINRSLLDFGVLILQRLTRRTSRRTGRGRCTSWTRRMRVITGIRTRTWSCGCAPPHYPLSVNSTAVLTAVLTSPTAYRTELTL